MIQLPVRLEEINCVSIRHCLFTISCILVFNVNSHVNGHCPIDEDDSKLNFAGFPVDPSYDDDNEPSFSQPYYQPYPVKEEVVSEPEDANTQNDSTTTDNNETTPIPKKKGKFGTLSQFLISSTSFQH